MMLFFCIAGPEKIYGDKISRLRIFEDNPANNM